MTVKVFPGTDTILGLCSVGILSTCDCSQTSFLSEDQMDFGPLIGAIIVNFRGSALVVTLKTSDTVSYVCGSVADGHDYCGHRTIKLYSMPSGVEATSSNFPFLTFDSIANQITFQSTKFEDIGAYEF